MKLPAKVIYAYRAVTELALHHHTKKPVRIHEIAHAQDIPKRFLVQILIRLKNAGIIMSTRGISGGYQLAKNPLHITLAEIIQAVDDSIISGESAMASEGKQKVDTIIGHVWDSINTTVREHLHAVTIDSIAAQLTSKEVTYNI